MSEGMEAEGYPTTALGRYWARVKARAQKKPVSTGLISADNHGFALDVSFVDRPTKRIADIAWSVVQSVDVYKRDLYVVDLICMAIETTEGQTVELHEGMEGWDKFVAALSGALPGCEAHADWWHSIAVPAFATNAQRIFRRDDGHSA